MATLYEGAVFGTVGRYGVTLSAIDHEGEILVVVQWFSNPALGLRRPEYVLPIASVVHQFEPDPKSPFRWVINDPLPEWLKTGGTPEQREQFGVRKGPDVTFPLVTTRH